MRKSREYSLERIVGIFFIVLGLLLIIHSVWIFLSKFLGLILGWSVLNFGLKLLGLPGAWHFFNTIWFLIRSNFSGTNYRFK